MRLQESIGIAIYVRPAQDCGGQYVHLIASRVRKHEALSVIVAADTAAAP